MIFQKKHQRKKEVGLYEVKRERRKGAFRWGSVVGSGYQRRNQSVERAWGPDWGRGRLLITENREKALAPRKLPGGAPQPWPPRWGAGEAEGTRAWAPGGWNPGCENWHCSGLKRGSGENLPTTKKPGDEDIGLICSRETAPLEETESRNLSCLASSPGCPCNICIAT